MKNNVFYALGLSFLLLAAGCTPEPVASFEAAVPAQPAPVDVQFTNTSQHADRYEWDFGDGQTSTEENPLHQYQEFGQMLVQLKAYQGEKVHVDSAFIEIPEPPRRRALIETAFGNMTVELSNRTPQHRDNFIKLVEQQYYDDLLFHRVINAFMIQGGDPDSKNAPANQMLGQGGPGYTVPAEFAAGLIHAKGALAAARLGDQANPQRASSGSQFYLVQGQPVTEQLLQQMESRGNFQYTPAEKSQYLQAGFGTPFLDRQYTVFGYVVEGLDVIDKIAAVPTNPQGNRPLEDVRMKIRMVE
jgi:peptidyl-prolyl cis-trans isomerase B (cyclophilin B)